MSPNPGPSWNAIGTGDFFAGGSSDILWQNTSTGQASIWEMNGNSLIGGGRREPRSRAETGAPSGRAISTATAFPTSCGRTRPPAKPRSGNEREQADNGGRAVDPNPGPAWKAIGTGDFNKDGDSDILWQNTSTGQVSIWEMSGNTLKGGGPGQPQSGAELGKRSGPAISTATAFPTTSFFRTKAPAKSRSGRWMGTNSWAGDRSAPIPGRAGTPSEPTAVPTSCFKTPAAKPRSGR